MPVIRIITYFEDTVNQVTEILRNEFDMALSRSIDKKKNRIDSFSYKRIQYVANLKPNRTELIEYRRLGHKKFEIQLCSMLQDAWSGIENELGYDTTAYPDESKRDFYRVGALLEMADIEFLKIRSEALKKAQTTGDEVQQSREVIEEAKAQTPEVIEVAPPANTFEEHLQAVAKEVPAPIVEMLPAAAPVEIPQVIAEVQSEIAEPVAHKVEEVALPVVEDIQVPVVEEIQTPVIAEVQPAEAISEAVVEQPQAIAPVEAPEHVLKTVDPVVAYSIVPKRAMPAAPQAPTPAAPQGIAPLRIKVPAVDLSPKIDIAAMNVDSNGALEVIPEIEKIADVVNIGPLVEQPAPAAPQEPQSVIVSAVAPVIETPEPIAPIVAEIPPIVQEVIAPKIESVVPPVVNDNTPKTPEAVQQTAPVQKAQSFFEEPAKAKVILDENAPMNENSLREYVLNSSLLKEIDMKIAERAGAKINPEIDIEGDVERLRFLKVFTLKQLQDRLTDNKTDIVAFAEKWIGKDNGGSFDSGISLFYLEYLLVGKKNDPAFAIEYVVKFISDNDYSARYIIPTYNSIRNEVPNNYSHLTIKA